MLINFIIIILLVLVVILILVLVKNINLLVLKNKELERNQEILTNELQYSKNQIAQQISNKNIESSNLFKNTTDTLDKKISNQNMEQLNIFQNTIKSMETKLSEQSNSTNNQVKEIIERVSRLDAVSKEILGLNTNIQNLERVLNDKKARGTFGEIRLIQIFESIFGENQKTIYEEQYLLSNGKIVDLILHAPYPLGDIGIDSKFPLENYQKIIEAPTDEILNTARKNFKKDMKKHIDDISSKYIIEGETANQALLFIPAEAIFTEINAYHEDIVAYSYQKKVWIASPTTLMAILNLLIVVLKDIKRNESSEEIYDQLIKLKIDFERYNLRWNNLLKHLETINKDIKEISITGDKLAKKFEEIEKVEFN